ncbi:MAG: DUF6616 family protein [Bacteroidota bacterium]
MIYFIELWNAKQAWLDLSQEERGNYMNQVGSHIQGLLEKGVKILTWSVNDAATSERADYDYFAVWSFPNQELADGFQQLVAGAGWYNYFEQVNVMGGEDSVENIIGKLIQL